MLHIITAMSLQIQIWICDYIKSWKVITGHNNSSKQNKSLALWNWKYNSITCLSSLLLYCGEENERKTGSLHILWYCKCSWNNHKKTDLFKNVDDVGYETGKALALTVLKVKQTSPSCCCTDVVVKYSLTHWHWTTTTATLKLGPGLNLYFS